MALITRPGAPSVRPGVAVATAPLNLELPAEKSQPKPNLGDYTWLIYGEKKIGKTSLAAQFPEALFMMFEPGGNGLSIYQRDVNRWEEFRGYIKLLKTTEQFGTIIIDTADIAYEKCLAYVGKREGFDHPSEMNDFGKSWQAISKEFSSCIHDLLSTGRGVMFLSHAKESEFQEASGRKYNKIVPTMSKSARDFVTGFVDVIAYYGYYGSDRLLTVRGSDTVDAGHRINGKFLVKDSDPAERIYSIPMGESPEEGYANIQRAFLNEQQDANNPTTAAGLSQSRRLPGKK